MSRAGVLSKTAILAKYGRSDSDWLLANIPFLDCPDQSILDTYYYRWWSYKQNILYKADFGGYVVNEGGGYGITPCPLGHHFYEGRWLRDPTYLNDNLRYWLSPRSTPRAYSNWMADAVYARFLAGHDVKALVDALEGLKANCQVWERERFDLHKSLFKWIPDRDGMEASVACWEEAARTGKYDSNTLMFGGEGWRPSFNSYMWADAVALSKIAHLAGEGLA
jgi:hypothetical protein